jgi:curved DNA-binding protein CbpA
MNKKISLVEMMQKISGAYEILSDSKKRENYTNPETSTVFLEDYLGFLEKHCGVKIWTGAEALRELLVGIDIKAESAKFKEEVKEAPQKSNLEKLNNKSIHYNGNMPITPFQPQALKLLSFHHLPTQTMCK